jgi:hypothetical protein
MRTGTYCDLNCSILYETLNKSQIFAMEESAKIVTLFRVDIVTYWSVIIDGFGMVIRIIGFFKQTTCDYALKITMTQSD